MYYLFADRVTLHTMGVTRHSEESLNKQHITRLWGGNRQTENCRDLTDYKVTFPCKAAQANASAHAAENSDQQEWQDIGLVMTTEHVTHKWKLFCKVLER